MIDFTNDSCLKTVLAITIIIFFIFCAIFTIIIVKLCIDYYPYLKFLLSFEDEEEQEMSCKEIIKAWVNDFRDGQNTAGVEGGKKTLLRETWKTCNDKKTVRKKKLSQKEAAEILTEKMKKERQLNRKAKAYPFWFDKENDPEIIKVGELLDETNYFE